MRADRQEARPFLGLLSRKQPTELVGTAQSAINRLEDAACDGHNLTMLRKIAAVLNQRVEVRFIPDRKTSSQARSNA